MARSRFCQLIALSAFARWVACLKINGPHGPSVNTSRMRRNTAIGLITRTFPVILESGSEIHNTTPSSATIAPSTKSTKRKMPAAENTSMKRSTSALLVGNAKAPAGSSYQFKTKVVCTLGPSCREKDILKGMLRAGMNVARFNFSHGTHQVRDATPRISTNRRTLVDALAWDCTGGIGDVHGLGMVCVCRALVERALDRATDPGGSA